MPRPLSDYAFCKTFIHTDSGHKSSRRRLDMPLECRVISFSTSISYAVGPSFRHPSFTTQISYPAKRASVIVITSSLSPNCVIFRLPTCSLEINRSKDDCRHVLSEISRSKDDSLSGPSGHWGRKWAGEDRAKV